MTEKEAAKYLRLSAKTLQRRRNAGQISYVPDGRLRYLMSDLLAYIDARRIAATAPPPAPTPKFRRTGQNSRANQEALLDLI